MGKKEEHDTKIKTILHVLNTGSFSGAERVAITIINGVQKKYPEKYKLVYVSKRGPIEEVLRNEGIEFEPIEKISISEMRRIIKKYKPDILHAHDFTASVYSSFFANSIPVISHIHNNSPWIKTVNAKTIVYAIACMRCEHILSVSDSVFSEYVFGNHFRDKETVVGNPIDVNRIRYDAKSFKEKKLIDILFLGRLAPEKNPLGFVEIIKETRKKYENIKACMVGDGALRNDVETAIKALGLEDAIEMKGFRSDPYTYLAKTKVLCMPSKWEGFGLAAVEALSLGVPVIASPVGGLKDIVTEKNGKLCNCTESFATEIYKLLCDQEYYSSKSQGAINTSDELNNIERYISSIESLYDRY